MRTHLVIVCMLLGVLFAPQYGWCAEGTEFAPKNKMFTITLPPGEQSAERRRVLMIDGHRIPVEASETTVKDGTRFLGASVGIPARMMRDIPADRRFDILRDAIVKELDGKVDSEKDITHDTIPGKEFLVQHPKGTARLQLYTVSGFVIYALVDGHDKAQVTTPQADAFFDSLKFSDKAKDVFRRVNR